MNRVPVASSSIKSVGYHEESKTLEVEFHGGRVYSYHGVGPEEHRGMLAAPSIGKHFSTMIRNRFAPLSAEEKSVQG